MDSHMTHVVILSAGLILQIAASYLAIRLVLQTGKRLAWLLALAAIFMAVRRAVALWAFVNSPLPVQQSEFFAESVAALTSLVLAVGLAGVGPLVQSLRRTADTLRESEQKYRTFFNAAGGALFIIRGDTFVDCNEAALTMFRCRAKDIIGRHLYDFSPPLQPDGRDSKEEALEKIQAALGGEPQVFEWLHKRTDGTTFPAEVHLNRFFLFGRPHLLAVVWDLTEQKRAQDQLRQLTAAYETFIRSSLVGIWRVEFDEPIPVDLPAEEIASRILDTGKFTHVNEAMSRMYGHSSAHDMLGKRVSSLIHKREESVRRLSEFVRRGFRFEYVENAEVDSHGGLRHFANSYVGLVNDGRLEAIWGVQIDITDRVRAIQALRDSEAKYRALIENAREIILVVQDQRIKFVNPMAHQLLGYSSEEVRDRPFIGFVHPDDRELVASRYAARLRGEEVPSTYEFRILAKSGEVRWFRLSATLITWEGRPATLNFLMDVTDRVEAEQALRDSEELFRNLTETTTSAILIYRGTRYLYVNHAMEEITGYSRDELLNMNFWEVVHPDQRDEVRQRGLARQRGEPVPERYEIKILRKDGQVRWVDFSAKPIIYKGEPAGLGTAIDITERKQLEEQLIQSQKMEAVGRLAGGVAHDFNNILTAIRGYTDLLLAEVEDGSQAQADLIEIRKAADRAADLTRQLLAFSRRQVLRPQPVNLNAVLQEMENMLARLIGEDVELELKLEPDLGMVEADPAQIQQVVMNLAVNARDAMPHGGKLTLETANCEIDSSYTREHPEMKPGRYVMLAVSDTGVGMDAETRARIFEPFFTTKELGKGTGLGLSTVYGIVKQSGGHIWVYSEPGQGTTFKIYLPRMVAPSEQVGGESQEALPNLHGTETILLVEDQDDVRQLAERALRRFGYRVLSAANAQEALRLIDEEDGSIDLVLADVVMPGMNGPELVERIRNIRPRVRVLYCSGYSDNAVLQKITTDREAAFLQKPYSPEMLLRKVRRVLDRS